MKLIMALALSVMLLAGCETTNAPDSKQLQLLDERLLSVEAGLAGVQDSIGNMPEDSDLFHHPGYQTYAIEIKVKHKNTTPVLEYFNRKGINCSNPSSPNYLWCFRAPAYNKVIFNVVLKNEVDCDDTSVGVPMDKRWRIKNVSLGKSKQTTGDLTPEDADNFPGYDASNGNIIPTDSEWQQNTVFAFLNENSSETDIYYKIDAENCSETQSASTDPRFENDGTTVARLRPMQEAK